MYGDLTSSGWQWRKARAFTLLELLTVIAIIGLIAALTAPAINGLRKGDAMSAGVRQMLDEVAYARQRALSDHTTVYMVFVPRTTDTSPAVAGFPANEKEQFVLGQTVSYALYVKRRAGDQPGQGNPRYLTPWRTLPEGVWIAPAKFAGGYSVRDPLDGTTRVVPGFKYDYFPYPVSPSPHTNAYLPYLAFNHLGGLESAGTNGVIPLVRGTISVSRTVFAPPDFVEFPPGGTTNIYNHIVIDSLTGRARLETPQIQ